MGKFFERFFTPVVYIQSDQCIMGIILRYVCWGTHRPPLGSPAADRPTRQPPRFGSAKPPPPPYNPQNGCTPLRVTYWLPPTPVPDIARLSIPRIVLAPAPEKTVVTGPQKMVAPRHDKMVAPIPKKMVAPGGLKKMVALGP